MFSPDLSAIQAYLLLCIWPIPVDTFGKEISTTLSSLMLQFSMNKGLHIRGVGQDFSRVTLNPEPSLEVLRAKLWISCLITAQRLSCAYGLPPPIIIDTFDDQIDDLPHGLLYERKVSQLLATATVELGRMALQASPSSASDLRSLVSVYTGQMSQLSTLEHDDMGHYHFLSALLQIQSFNIFIGQAQADPVALIKLYSTACSVIEKILELDDRIQLSQCASDYTGRMIYLASSIILRMYRGRLKRDIDLGRGQLAYQSAINLFRKMSIHKDDVMARSTVIITQLWNSSTIFNQPDGTSDSFSMLCRSRLTMSSVFDVWWRWREEFAGQPHPYPEAQSPTSQRSREHAIRSSNDMLPIALTPGPPFEIRPEDDWGALFDLPAESWDLFNLDNDHAIGFDDYPMPLPTL
ncbi:uncharacterized protein AB675_2818 [Cyphellophora attinorum]|uniref:Transcription factor domain-containing protein n=1 Tax=Cyphellophora attinorum TaxID=1664694 RepID=A0A0N1P1I5_9EURO|nr:uncharacterized protein AB675_2818 [Phialophora attinorum]KPI45236.1 hypothetical protein AB675_2818 [Phialophora attinorum]